MNRTEAPTNAQVASFKGKEIARNIAKNIALRGGLVLTSAAVAFAPSVNAFTEGNPDQKEPSPISDVQDIKKIYRAFTFGLAAQSSIAVDKYPLTTSVTSPADGSVDLDGLVKIEAGASDENDEVTKFSVLINGKEVEDGLLCSQSHGDTPTGPVNGQIDCDAEISLPNGDHTITVTAENSKGEIVTEENKFKVESFITSGKVISDPDAFKDGFHFKTITDGEEFIALQKTLKGEEAEMYELKNGETGFIAVKRTKDGNHEIRLQEIKENEYGKMEIIIDMLTAEPEFHTPAEDAKRVEYNWIST